LREVEKSANAALFVQETVWTQKSPERGCHSGPGARELILPADLMSDNATHHGSADGADRAAREERTADRAYAGTHRGIFIPPRHPAAATETGQH